MAPGLIEPNAWVALRLPSDNHSLVELKPNTTISIGKYGHFQANQILGRPYYLTFEILDLGQNGSHKHKLRIVPPSELHAASLEDLEDEAAAAATEVDGTASTENEAPYEIAEEGGKLFMRTNQYISDDSKMQVLSMEEIERLKASSTGSGKDLVAKILESHSELDKKTAFALAKYTLRKSKKYLKRFTVLPIDVSLLAKWMLREKDAGKILELKEETLSLMKSWLNVHHTPDLKTADGTPEASCRGRGRWLVVDDTSGLVTAALAESMGILHPQSDQTTTDISTAPSESVDALSTPEKKVELAPQATNGDTVATSNQDHTEVDSVTDHQSHRTPLRLSTTNTLTVIHSLSQPNLSLLRYFSFSPFSPPPSHPLTARLRTLSWLQLLSPESDSALQAPLPTPPSPEFRTWKPAKRGHHYRKHRRYERIKQAVDETRAGGFDGLMVASVMRPESVLRHLLPLLRGGAQVVLYSPHLEPLAELADLFSTARRVAFISKLESEGSAVAPDDEDTEFPLDPRLLLAPTIYTVRAREWQVLPGRTHPLMTGRGGAEGYVFVGTRVLPGEGIRARGTYSKKRKVEREEPEGEAVGVVIEKDEDVEEQGEGDTRMAEQ